MLFDQDVGKDCRVTAFLRSHRHVHVVFLIGVGVMASEVLNHYETLLGPVYSWSLGNFNDRVAASAQLFKEELGDGNGAKALDLGCGTGVQTLALIERGFRVTGVDFSRAMLDEYTKRTAAFDVCSLQEDLANFSVTPAFKAVVCFGDTVSHLQSWQAVSDMFSRTYKALVPGGVFLLATRDHTRIYRGDERFLLVQADADRSMTCFVEDDGDHIRITDLLHERINGRVELKANSYRKLRVGPQELSKQLTLAGFSKVTTKPWGGIHLLRAQA
jgi:SAM-dependent methyltransferase